jgi:cyclic di-GMP phosphodiesterase
MSQAVSRPGPRTDKPRQPSQRGAKRAGPRRPRAHEGSTDLRRASELAALIESTGDAVLGVSPDGAITHWSDGAERLLGYPRVEAIGRLVTMLAPAGRTQEAGAIGRELIAGERVERMETERRTKDGRLLRVQLSVSPIWSADGQFAGSVGIMRDLTEQRAAEAALRASEMRYHSVVDALSEGVMMQDLAGRVLAYNKSAESILGLSAHELGTAFPGDTAPRLLHEDGSPVLEHEHPTSASIRTGKPQSGVVMGVEDHAGEIRWLSINSRALTRPGESAPYAAVASFTDITELRETLEELHAARLEDLKRLALVGEYRDDDTNRHTERVARTAGLLASELGLEEELIQMIQRAAPLHDVGKIGIPDSILLKQGALTHEEFEVIRTHTVIGGRILCESHFPILKVATEIAFTHHERWDGTGYPARLKGEEIPITGRIVAVADAFDAMTHARPYKSAFAVEHAVAEIDRCSGSQFDPRVVRAFMTLAHRELVDAGERAAERTGKHAGEQRAKR